MNANPNHAHILRQRRESTKTRIIAPFSQNNTLFNYNVYPQNAAKMAETYFNRDEKRHVRQRATRANSSQDFGQEKRGVYKERVTAGQI